MKQVLRSHCEDVIWVLVTVENFGMVFRQGNGIVFFAPFTDYSDG